MNNTPEVKEHLFFDLIKIKTMNRLRRALKHNKREAPKELEAALHIDGAKTPLNYSLLGVSTSSDLLTHTENALWSYQKNIGKAVRHDAVVAIEVLFSVPIAKSEIDLHQYFADCLAWATTEFFPAEPLSAEVHLDESNPHVHLIFLCVTHSRLVASMVTGNKRKYRSRRENFYTQVAQKYGLELPPPALNRKDRKRLAQQVIEHFQQTNDPITLSKHYPAICESVQKNPAPFAASLGLVFLPTAPKMRTLTQIFTSKGRGTQFRGST